MPDVVFHHRDFRCIASVPAVNDVISYREVDWQQIGTYRAGSVGSGEPMAVYYHPEYPLYEPIDTRLRLHVTPADLEQELGVPQKSIRTYLRSRYGTLQAEADRWRLVPSQADDVRVHFGGAG